MNFSPQLVTETKEYFKRRFNKNLSDEAAQETLNQLAELGSLFAKNADKLLEKRRK